MADAVVSAVFKHLASLALGRIEEEARLVKDVGEEVPKLKSNLKAIQAVLDDAEKKQLTDDNVKIWLDQLNDVSHDIDDVLDEWNSHVLKLQIQEEGDDDASTETETESNKVCFPKIPWPFSCWPFSCFESKVAKLTLHHEIAHKIKQLNGKLDEIASERGTYNLNTATVVDHPIERPKTSSLTDETVIYGRDDDKKALVSMLTESSSIPQPQDRELVIISLVGMGGLGKTTLAQIAFNDEKVVAHFDERIWVCVSDPFDEFKVANAIIESIEGSQPNIKELDTSLRRVVKCLEGKKFLLVLDDVWTKDPQKWEELRTEDRRKWEELRKALLLGTVGSRVLVTTRKQEVVTMMRVEPNCIIRLKHLSEEHCWLVFERLAFFGRGDEEREILEETGRKIARKCRGLPLVAKSLGSLLCTKKTETQWDDVLHSELWKLKKVDEIFAPLLLSYYDLSVRERRCFSYCSIFPKDHRIKRDQLIEMWMAQNYLNLARPEEEGRKFFDNLVARSFFQNFENKSSDGSVTHCKMHDIVHDLAQFLTENECLTIEDNNAEEKILKLHHQKTRHLTLAVGSDTEFPTLEYNEINKRNMRTVFNVSSRRWSITHDGPLFLQLKCLRSLTLFSLPKMESLTNIGGLIHLRYLDLSWYTNLEELPGALCDLCNLQTLNLSHCHSLEKLPEGIGKLVNLRHLYVTSCFRLKGLPKGIGKLTNLRSLDTLFAAKNEEAVFDIGDLKRLSKLRLRGEVEIKECRKLASLDEAEKVHLKNIISQDVYNLRLDFGEWREGIGMEEDSAILEELKPPQNMQDLSINSYMGVTLAPRWMMSLINLRSIHLSSCNNCETLPCLGGLPCLQIITFSEMTSVKKVGLEFLGIPDNDEDDSSTESAVPSTSSMITLFPKLKTLMFNRMDQFEKWEGTISNRRLIRIMPCLVTLHFQSCPRLQVLPDFLETTTSLKQLVIYSSQTWTGKEWAKISHVPNIIVGGKYVQKDGKWIQEGRRECS